MKGSLQTKNNIYYTVLSIKDKNGKNFLYDKNVVALRNDRDILAVGSAAYEI